MIQVFYNYEYLFQKKDPNFNDAIFNVACAEHNGKIYYLARMKKYIPSGIYDVVAQNYPQLIEKNPILKHKSVPGNMTTCNNVDDIDKSIGHFWGWSLQASHTFFGDDTDILGYYENKKFVVVKKNIRLSDDCRMYSYDNKLIIYSAVLKNIFVCDIQNDNLKILYKTSASVIGRNFSLYQVEKTSSDYIFYFLDWFYKDGLRNIVVHDGKVISSTIINYSNPYFSGNPTTYLPGFSFGTPTIKINGKYYGVGHSKIPKGSHSIQFENIKLNTFVSNLEKFYQNNFGPSFRKHYGSPFIDQQSKRNLEALYLFKKYSANNMSSQDNSLLQSTFGSIDNVNSVINLLDTSKVNSFLNSFDINQYSAENLVDRYTMVFDIGCSGYIYMMYFYTWHNNKFMISDSFIPLHMDKEFKFNLIFPMGLMINDNNVIITAGEGDTYGVKMKFKLDEINKLCVHDISNFNYTNYNFYVLKQGQSMWYFDDLVTHTGGYYKKYLKYKLKYQNLKKQSEKME